MHFSTALHRGKLIKRYKRFLADVELSDGSIVTAHCPNTGSMKSCYDEGSIIWLSFSDNPSRKLAWTWEFTETEGGFIGVNTARPNLAVENAIRERKIPTLDRYNSVRREVKYGKNSRIDLLLEADGQPSCFIEVKNTTLKRGDGVLFPDAVTERGRKHLEELSEMVKLGHRSVMLFFVNRPDGSFFAPADEIDHAYGKALREAMANGVEVLAIRAVNSLTQITTGELLPIKL